MIPTGTVQRCATLQPAVRKSHVLQTTEADAVPSQSQSEQRLQPRLVPKTETLHTGSDPVCLLLLPFITAWDSLLISASLQVVSHEIHKGEVHAELRVEPVEPLRVVFEVVSILR